MGDPAALLLGPPPRGPQAAPGGGSARFAVLWEGSGDGEAEGYVTYRVKPGCDEGLASYTLAVEDLVAADPEVRAGLWRYCFGVDLVRTVVAWNVPVDETLAWMLNDPRRLRFTGIRDFLWVRLLDVEAALAARSYGPDAAPVVDVADRSRARPGPRRRRPGVGVPGRRPLHHAGPGRTGVGARARALARADALFACAPAPACSTMF